MEENTQKLVKIEEKLTKIDKNWQKLEKIGSFWVFFNTFTL